jgi:hypothetical protein
MENWVWAKMALNHFSQHVRTPTISTNERAACIPINHPLAPSYYFFCVLKKKREYLDDYVISFILLINVLDSNYPIRYGIGLAKTMIGYL